MAGKLCDLKNTSLCAEELAREILGGPKEKAVVIGLSGDLGSGKTAFTQAFAKALGISETVASPTFVIEKIYKLPPGKNSRHLIHIDTYRLESEEELRALGFEEIISDPGNIVVIEWPERVGGLIPKDALEIKFKFIDDKTREISWSS